MSNIGNMAVTAPLVRAAGATHYHRASENRKVEWNKKATAKMGNPGGAWIAETTFSNWCSVQRATSSGETESLSYGCSRPNPDVLSFHNQWHQLEHFDGVIQGRSPLRAVV